MVLRLLGGRCQSIAPCSCSRTFLRRFVSTGPRPKTCIIPHNPYTRAELSIAPLCLSPLPYALFGCGACFSRANFIPTMRFARSPRSPEQIRFDKRPRELRLRRDEIYGPGCKKRNALFTMRTSLNHYKYRLRAICVCACTLAVDGMARPLLQRFKWFHRARISFQNWPGGIFHIKQVHLCVQSAHRVRVVPCNCAAIFGVTETFSNRTHFYAFLIAFYLFFK